MDNQTEDLRNDDYVFDLNKQVSIKWIYGNETGYIYEITTNDGLSVNVTKTHPMKICKMARACTSKQNCFLVRFRDALSCACISSIKPSHLKSN